MSEPVYLAQTSAYANVRNTHRIHEWIKARLEEARAKGGRFPRVVHERGALLIEVWADRLPPNPEAPRWSLAPTVDV